MEQVNLKNSKVLRSGRKTKVGFIRRLHLNVKRHPLLYLMALPVVLYYLVFQFWPMYGVTIAFQRFIPALGMTGSEWIGFDNFIRFFNDRNFSRIVSNTFIINFYDLIVGFPFPIIFALLLNEIRSVKFKKTAQTITYMPYFISLVVVGGLISTFSKEAGPIAQLVATISGRPAENLLSNPRFFRHIFVWSNIWQGFGWGSIIYFAALSNADQEQYEAAVIDGAGRWKQMRYVTLPALAPTIVIMLILRIGAMMSIGHEKIILLYSPITYRTADVISSYVFRMGLVQLNFSYGAAVGLFNSVINLTLLLVANTVSRRVNETSLW